MIGYMVVTTKNMGRDGKPDADWDGEVHETFDAAWAECLSANGEEWAADVTKFGLQDYHVREASYLPYALTLALSDKGSSR